uniref:PIH1_CS domain-containing protein n=1 Tax=Echinostoma caproni TaxID=27848 RepID=A0A183AR89_9TREM
LPENTGEREQSLKPKTRQDESNWYQLIWLGLHYLEQEKQLTTVESNSVICTAAPLRPKILHPSPEYGSEEVILKSIGFHKRLIRTQRTHSPINENDNIEHTINEILKDIIPQNVGESLPDGILDNTREEPTVSYGQPFQLPQRIKAADNKPLIEELDTKIQVSETVAPKSMEEATIQWHAEIVAHTDKRRGSIRSNQLKVVFELPGVRSGAQCDLDITAEKLLLMVMDSPIAYKPLEITLPCKVDIPNAEAKFSIKRESLTLFVPILPSNP